MLLWLVLIFLVIALVMFVQKVVLKSAMQKKLGPLDVAQAVSLRSAN